MSPVFTLTPGSSPILVTIPHAGTALAPGMEARMTVRGLRLPDTDWYMPDLYNGAALRGVGVLTAHYSRYVVDLNRGADDAALYPGRPSTGLAPHLTFDGTPIYLEGEAPGGEEIAQRTEAYWRPYHDAVTAELKRLRAKHGWAILWDAHSIRSQVERLFEGVLPDLNVGTNSGASCAASLSNAVMEQVGMSPDYTHVLNGRFRGGYTTRHYGTPGTGVHAVQLEIAQSTYLASEDDPWPADATKSARLRDAINGLLDTLLSWTPEG
ncbi:N-formylglutamate amidohydrolase [Acetobacter nitrogenifigens DSM 23921 = NBRC 105050]|uniref:N-formylglutamate deformylase n=1 Tax=Acetobacter nitrogenifigens DSM 23921 = NBRC 105050 TaxID=1120919 RepID=A0A511X8T6_9PROT|nr:N-formylglutamate deformylase [Acetobacter nitrogenifigens]GBQ87435.1 N-formylglutamate amidohydrolase [Acetobacter nitrogenifigens DSM 23921 = NBRC 105050]GEN59349.1 N-formylglutamate deformylase [Acetobacter nitrogenifigens DSM 23921 = NBRC 105050]